MLTTYSSPLFHKESRYAGSRFFNGVLRLSASNCINYINQRLQLCSLDGSLANSAETTAKKL